MSVVVLHEFQIERPVMGVLVFPLLLANANCGTNGTVGKWYATMLGLYSPSGKTSYRKISWSLEAARFEFKLFQSLWNLAGTSAALLPRCLSNFRAIRPLQHPISRLRDFTRFGGKTSYRLVNRGPDVTSLLCSHLCRYHGKDTLCSVKYL